MSIVGVQHGCAIRWQRLDQLTLSARNSVNPIRKVFRMSPANIRHYADLRPGNPRQFPDLARMVHPHLQHRHRVAVRQTQNRKRQPQMIVQVANISPGRKRGRKQRRDGFLGRRFACAAGHADHSSNPRPPHLTAQGL